MSGLKIDTAWTVKAVSTTECKTHLRIDSSFSDDDTYIGNLITTAQNLVEQYTNRSITNQTLSLYLDTLPFHSDIKYPEGIYTAPDLDYNSNFIVLPNPPVSSVSAVYYYDSDDTQSTFAASNYYVDIISEQARVVLKNGKSWPTATALRNANAFQVTYVAGYGSSASDVPENIKQSIKFLVAQMYENREIVTSMNVKQIPYTVGALLLPYKVQRLSNRLGG